MRSKGFTLIEMAIVLVIIGIILAAVIKGQDLITNAKAKKIAGQIRGLEAAIWGFYDKFGRLPGDTTTPPDGVIDNPTAAMGNLTNIYNFRNLASNDSVAGETYVINGTGSSGYPINFIRINNIPGYLAIYVDAHIDGIENGTGGRFRRNDSAADWPNNATLVNATYFFENLPQ